MGATPLAGAPTAVVRGQLPVTSRSVLGGRASGRRCTKCLENCKIASSRSLARTVLTHVHGSARRLRGGRHIRTAHARGASVGAGRARDLCGHAARAWPVSTACARRRLVCARRGRLARACTGGRERASAAPRDHRERTPGILRVRGDGARGLVTGAHGRRYRPHARARGSLVRWRGGPVRPARRRCRARARLHRGAGARAGRSRVHLGRVRAAGAVLQPG